MKPVVPILDRAAQSPLGLVTISAHAIERYRKRHVADTGAKYRLGDERMWDKIAGHLARSRVAIRKNEAAAILRHGKPAKYLVDGRWILVVSERGEVLTAYSKRTHYEIMELFRFS